nr:AAA family ATPase [bacterium]
STSSPNSDAPTSKSDAIEHKIDQQADSLRPNMKEESKNKYFSEEPTMPWIKETKPSDAFSLHVPDDQTLEELYEELNSLVGLDMVKRDVRSLVNFIKISSLRSQRGMKVPDVSYHLVFTGNPGTGKTTIARLVAKLYHHMGLLPEGQLIESDRSSLVAGYMGQTAIKTQKVIRNAIGGVLFIDEAYSLVSSDDDSYGKEAVETLLKAMEDNRGEFVVIVAGYDELMHKFIDSNPGLSSRFNKYFRFDDYTGGQMLEIFHRFCKISGYSLKAEAVPILEAYLNERYQKREEHFGNARMVRNIFEKAISAQADRLAALSDLTDHDLEAITSADIEQSLAKMQ